MLCDVLVVYYLHFMCHVFPNVVLIFVEVGKVCSTEFPYRDNKGYGMVDDDKNLVPLERGAEVPSEKTGRWLGNLCATFKYCWLPVEPDRIDASARLSISARGDICTSHQPVTSRDAQ